jgi:hypothetical protein
LAFPVTKLLDNDWQVYLGDRTTRRGTFSTNFLFEGVSAADAENLADAKAVVIRGKVQEITLPQFSSPTPEWGAIYVVLQDVQVDGKKWKKRPEKKGGGGFGPGGQ